MLNVVFENLTPRQEAYRKVCERYGIEIGNERTSAGEDSANYFVVINDEGERCEPEPVEQFCAITEGEQGIHYAIPDYDHLANAQDRAGAYVGDDIYAERPVAVIDLDTGDEYVATLSAAWARPGETVVLVPLDREWYEQVCRARSELGSNDEEHDLLCAVADEVYERLGHPEHCDGCGTLTDDHHSQCPMEG